MAAPIPLTSPTLYDQDYALWLETTLEQLRRRDFAGVDWENLIEEIENMGRSDKRALKSLLTVLLEHLLKLAYWESNRKDNANHWSREIAAFRDQIQDILADSPSLKSYLEEIFGESYQKALQRLALEMGVKRESLPATPIFSLEQALDAQWFPLPLG